MCSHPRLQPRKVALNGPRDAEILSGAPPKSWLELNSGHPSPKKRADKVGSDFRRLCAPSRAQTHRRQRGCSSGWWQAAHWGGARLEGVGDLREWICFSHPSGRLVAIRLPACCRRAVGPESRRRLRIWASCDRGLSQLLLRLPPRQHRLLRAPKPSSEPALRFNIYLPRSSRSRCTPSSSSSPVMDEFVVKAALHTCSFGMQLDRSRTCRLPLPGVHVRTQK